MATRHAASKAETIAVGYVRVSTGEQGDSGLGLAAQRAAIRAECARRGWRLHKVLSDVASAKTTSKRSGLTETLTTLDEGAANVLVVAKLDRLARSTLDFATIAERAERRHWSLVALDANIDTTSPSGRLMLDVLASFASYERRLISARTSAALQVKKQQGARLGRPVTLPDAVRQRVVRERGAGATLTAIAGRLTAERVPTARGGNRWYPSTVAAVLSSMELDGDTITT